MKKRKEGELALQCLRVPLKAQNRLVNKALNEFIFSFRVKPHEAFKIFEAFLECFKLKPRIMVSEKREGTKSTWIVNSENNSFPRKWNDTRDKKRGTSSAEWVSRDEDPNTGHADEEDDRHHRCHPGSVGALKLKAINKMRRLIRDLIRFGLTHRIDVKKPSRTFLKC